MQKNNALVPVVAAVIYKKQKVLLVRRGPDMSGAGNWEFPGGKVETSETEIQALQREISEELQLKISVQECLGENIHQYPTKKIHLRFYLVPMPDHDFKLTEHDAFEWVQPRDLDLQKLSEADRPIIAVLTEHALFKIP